MNILKEKEDKLHGGKIESWLEGRGETIGQKSFIE